MNSIIVGQIMLTPGTPEQTAAAIALRKVGLSPAQATAAVCRRSVDARKPGRIKMVYSVRITPYTGETAAILSRVTDQKNIRLLTESPSPPLARGTEILAHRPVVTGFGPAGIFAALLLARAHMRPLVLERGPDMDSRAAACTRFWQSGELDPEANVQFGEGGAGSFSDGKLTTRIGDPRCRTVLETFAAHGASPDVLIEAHPHVGTDKLREIVKSMRREIIALGGEVRFGVRLTGLRGEGILKSAETSVGEIPCEALVLAVGHSARDTVTMLAGLGTALEKKPFSVGFRIEHTQGEVNDMFYGAGARPSLPPAEYQLSHRAGERGCYTFCMCPGGVVVPAASEVGGIVTNGMSYSGRDGAMANAAVVASVLPEDILGGPLEAIACQRAIERAAFSEGYRAPMERADKFAGIRTAKPTAASPTYARGVRERSLAGLLPPGPEALLKAGLARFEGLYPGFAGGILTGIETRTSAPWRMPREDGQLTGLGGVYPAGEGAGYAGGIVSAAVDGLRAAEAILARYGALREGP
ncbi:MAG TPA: hypothetical protein VN446_05025 [Candidatus Acidoferrum sp.]|nr:hypothetical protein [Candidatus Acidoferrum sp.]